MNWRRRKQLAEAKGWHTISGPFWNGVEYYMNGFTADGSYREVPPYELSNEHPHEEQ